MATLPSGAPYMVGTDLNNTIDDYTLTNANYWDARVPVATAAGITGSFSATQTITFPVGRFSTTPAIVLGLKSTTPSNNETVTYAGESAAGFTIYKWRGGGTAATVTTTVSWVAVGS